LSFNAVVVAIVTPPAGDGGAADLKKKDRHACFTAYHLLFLFRTQPPQAFTGLVDGWSPAAPISEVWHC